MPDWGAIFAGFAILISLFTLWYSVFRRGQLSFACSRLTAIGMASSGRTASAFAIKVDVINSGSRPIVLRDLLLEANTNTGKRIFYDPILLFDLTNYVASVGQQNRIATSQKGQAPLPISIPAGQHFEFGYEILFMPHDKKTAVETPDDAPMTLDLYALTSRKRKYRHIVTQEISSDDVKSLVNGSFSGVL